MSNALLFTIAAKENIPALRAVRFERDKDGTLVLVSSDRYRLFNETVEHTLVSGKTEFGFLLAHDDAKRLADLLKGAGRFGQVMLTVEDTRLKVQAGGVEITLGFEEAAFPKWRKLMPSEDTATDVGAIALNPTFLGHIGKLKLATANTPAQLKFYGHNKPVRISFHDGPLVWQMPVVIDSPKAAAKAA
ncbi:hypothetical protein [Streptomyces sp. NPDC056061]|uniref:hypothetical protein n=1 Tax=Streptomyces sp. NPDC056061 TaxID=3345700 RepID=UPI0035DECC12